MSLDELLISTGVDSLIKLVHDKGKVELGAAAKALNASSQMIEEWAHVLEEEGIIKIEYQFTKVYLIWTTPSREVLAQKVEKIEAKKGEVQERVGGMVGRLDEKGAELEKLEREYSELITSLDPKMLGLSEKVKKLKEMEKEEDATYAKHLENVEALKTRLAEISSKVSDVEKSLGAALEEAPKVSEQDIHYLREYAEELKGNVAHAEANIAKIEKQIEAQREAINKIAEAGGLKKEEASAMLNELKRFREELVRERERIKGEAEEISSSIKDQVSAYEQLQSLRAKSAKGGANYANMLQKFKSDFEAGQEEIEKSNEHINSTIYAYKKEIDAGVQQINYAIESLESALSKKDDVQDILNMINQLKKEHQKLSSDAKLLAKELKVLEMQVGEGKGGKQKFDGIKQRIELSEEEEAEFDKKREDLRNLIKKMWEEGA